MKNSCSNCKAENDLSYKYCSICGYKMPFVENQNIKTVEKNDDKIRKSERKYNLKTFIGFIVGFIIMFFLTQSLFKPSIDKRQIQLASAI
jgi:uncharacterized membrane protein YvbJ